MKKADVEKEVNSLLRDNQHNLDCPSSGYDKGYAEGYHDALVDVLKKFDIDTEEEYYN